MSTMNATKVLVGATLLAVGLGANAGSYDGSVVTREHRMTIDTPAMGERTTRSTVVYFGDLNLNNNSGVATLYSRLERASKSVCSPRPQRTDLAGHRDWKSCRSDALDSAVSDVGLDAMTSVHLAETGRLAAPDETPIIASR